MKVNNPNVQLKLQLELARLAKMEPSATMDGWSSISGKGYEAIMLHGINDNWERVKFLVAMYRVTGHPVPLMGRK